MAVPAGFPTTGLRFCFEALQEAGTDGSTLGTLTDQSGNGFHAAQGTAARQAVFRASGIGGKAAIEFDGVDDYYPFPTAALGMFQAVGGGTLVMVVTDTGSLTATVNRRPIFASRGSTSGAARIAVSHVSTGGTAMISELAARRLDGDTAGVIGGTATSNSPVARVGMVDWSNSVGVHYKNGDVEGRKAPFLTAGLTENTASLAINVGANGRAADSNLGNFWRGPIALVATWNRVLTDTERSDIAKYVQDTYGIIQSNYPKVSVTSSRATTWAVSALVTASRATTWDVRALVTAARSTAWRVLVQVGVTRSTSWDIRAAVTATRTALWNVKAIVGAARATTWHVFAGAVQTVLRKGRSTLTAAPAATSAVAPAPTAVSSLSPAPTAMSALAPPVTAVSTLQE